MSGITTHVLDTAAGRPAAGLAVALEKEAAGGTWEEVSRKVTNGDGRIADFALRERPAPGTYRLRFATGAYFARQGVAGFYPEVTIAFTLASPEEHYHVPLLLSPYGYSTYRGS
jgi:5-hydroxyisourate hydrolase